MRKCPIGVRNVSRCNASDDKSVFRRPDGSCNRLWNTMGLDVLLAGDGVRKCRYGYLGAPVYKM